MSSEISSDASPRSSSVVIKPPLLVTETIIEEDDSINNGHSGSDSVRIFHPDEVILKTPSPSIPAPSPLKSSFRSITSPSGSQVLTIKADEKPPKDTGRANSSNAKNAGASSTGAKPHHRSSHQRFPSTGLSLPSSSGANGDSWGAASERRGSSQTFPTQRSAIASPPVLPATTGTQPTTYNSSHVRGHRRQPSTGKEQRRVNFCPYDGYCFVLDETRCGICAEERGSLPAPGNDALHTWKKVLYEKTGLEDNYTDRNLFLAELKKNVNVQEYSYQLVMADSLVVTQQIAVVVLFVAIFMHMLSGSLTGNSLGVIDIVLAMGGYLVWAVCQPYAENRPKHTQLWSFASVLKLIGYSLGLYVITPVLAALTDPISDDTIAALSIILLLIHLSFQDYGYLNPEQIRPRLESKQLPASPSSSNGSKTASTEPSFGQAANTSHTSAPKVQRRGSSGEAPVGLFAPATAPTALYQAPVSLNAAIFASLLLASRLRSDSNAFVLIALAVEMFALFPIMAHHLKAKSWWGSVALVWTLVALAVALLRSLSSVVTYVYIASIFFTTFGSPFCLQWIQRYKNEIHGPWDEAVPARARRHGTRQ